MQLRHINRDIVSAVIISEDSKILMGKKDPAKAGVYSNCWHIPGGGIDDCETQIQALIREIMEETGLDISNSAIEIFDQSNTGIAEKTLKDTGEKVICHMNFNIYLVKLPVASEKMLLNPTDDLVELKWISINRLDSIELTPPSVELFKKMGYLS